MNDALYYANRIVLAYKPRAIVLYEGDNDIAQGISPKIIRDTFLEFVDFVHNDQPASRIYFLSIKPSLSRWEVWEEMKKANKLIEKECLKNTRLTYVDISTPMLNEYGLPKAEIFLPDNLHMNKAGYEIWTNTLKPILMDNEIESEQ